MKRPSMLFLTLFLMGTASMSKAQIPFGKKNPPPAVKTKDEWVIKGDHKKEREVTYNFDSLSRRFTRRRPGQWSDEFPESSPATKKMMTAAARPPVNTGPVFHLTRDINQLSESFPGNNPANEHYSFAVLNNISYFFSDDGIHGRELWRSDGTAAGTSLVLDINPGEAGSGSGDIITANGLLFFSAITPDKGGEPWVSDGTTAGTHLLKDLNPDMNGSYPNQFVNVNGSVFFSASYFGSNEQLWKTDGTVAGTTLVTDLWQRGMGYRMFELTAVNNMAYFIAYTWSSGYQLFRSDGTDAGTYVAREIGFNYDYSGFMAPTQLTAYNNRLYFSANDGTGRKLWTSDGSYPGTYVVPGDNGVFLQQDFVSIYHNSPLSIMKGALYLAGFTEASGGGLYTYDANKTEGIVLVKDLTDEIDLPWDSVAAFVVPVDITVMNDKIYFKVINSMNGQQDLHDELWSSDGQPDHTILVKTIGGGQQGVYSYNFYNGNGTLYFVINNDPVYGNELWKSDGSSAGTVVVKDINPGKNSSSPDDLTFCNGKLLFRATNTTNGTELWSSNGTEAGTSLVKDINTTSTQGSSAGFLYKGIGETRNGIVFNAYTADLGGELYKSDGTSGGTVLLNDIATGEDWSYPNNYLFKNNLTYFIADNAVGTALYSTNGNASGLKRITPYINRSFYNVLNYNIATNGIAFYTLGNRSTGSFELWRSDGTEIGTFMLTPNLSYYYNNYVETLDNTAIFIAGDYVTGYELWRSDGTIKGTKMIKDINPGPAGSDPYSLFVYKNIVYFGAYDGLGFGFHKSLWKSDGTEKGTVKVKSIEPTFYYSYFNSEPQHVYCVSNGTLFLSATEYNSYGNELWKTNGTEKGTNLVFDINPFYSSSPNFLTDLDGELFFTADDGVHGMELWSSKGTAKTTSMIKDVTPGFGSSYFWNLCVAGGKLFFINSSAGGTLWSSDGSAANTKEIIDDGLAGLTNISQLTGVGDKLFFGAYNSKYGTELYSGNVGGSRFNPVTMRSSNDLEETAMRFDVSLYPNPSRTSSVLRITGDTKNTIVIVADISGKIMWRKEVRNEQVIQLPLDLATGVYFVTVKTGSGMKTLRFVKE